MDTWKSFDKNLTHSAVHHLVAIADLIDDYGYARVSDVARALEITRGSVSLTLKRLHELGLVEKDDRRFLGLSPAGRRIADSTRLKKQLMMRLFTDVLGVDPEHADEDTCKIEHLVSNATTRRASEVLEFLDSGAREAQAFLDGLERFRNAITTGGALDLAEARVEDEGESEDERGD